MRLRLRAPGSTSTFTSNLHPGASHSSRRPSIHRPADVNLFAIVNGLIILVLAEVVREGTRLDEDQSLTV